VLALIGMDAALPGGRGMRPACEIKPLPAAEKIDRYEWLGVGLRLGLLGPAAGLITTMRTARFYPFALVS
jgi:hypothetical protein